MSEKKEYLCCGAQYDGNPCPKEHFGCWAIKQKTRDNEAIKKRENYGKRIDPGNPSKNGLWKK